MVPTRKGMNINYYMKIMSLLLNKKISCNQKKLQTIIKLPIWKIIIIIIEKFPVLHKDFRVSKIEIVIFLMN